MADIIDTANDQADLFLAVRLKSRKQYSGTSATHCVECDEPIPQRRREAVPGCTKCVECAE